jgi:2'-5' RNA ligase
VDERLDHVTWIDDLWPTVVQTGGARRPYFWLLTFDGRQALHELASAYQKRLAELPSLDMVPSRWLHLTMHSVGVLDNVPAEQVQSLVEAVAARLERIDPFDLSFREAVVLDAGVALLPSAVDEVSSLRAALRTGPAESGHEDPASDSPEFNPHVSIAYNNRARAAGPVVDVVDAAEQDLPAARVTVTVTAVELVALEIDTIERICRWRRQEAVALGQPRRTS